MSINEHCINVCSTTDEIQLYQEPISQSRSLKRLTSSIKPLSTTTMVRDILSENLTPEDLDVAIAETKKVPGFLNVHIALRFQRSGDFPEVSWRSFWIKNDEGKRVDIVVREFLVPG